MGCVRETPQIKMKPARDVWGKEETIIETPDGEKCLTTYFWRDVSICNLFLFCIAFIKLSFIQIFALVVLSFITWRVPFTSERLCGGLFSSFSCFLWLLSPLVAFFSFFFSFSFLFLFFFSVLSRAVVGLLCFVWLFRFVVVVFCWAVFHPLFPLLVLFSAVCRAWIHSLFSFFS